MAELKLDCWDSMKLCCEATLRVLINGGFLIEEENANPLRRVALQLKDLLGSGGNSYLEYITSLEMAVGRIFLVDLEIVAPYRNESEWLLFLVPITCYCK